MIPLLKALREAQVMLLILALIFGGVVAGMFSAAWVFREVGLVAGYVYSFLLIDATLIAICYFTRYPK